MILNDNSTQQINTLVIQLQNKITNLSNELKSLNKEINDLDSKISDLEIRDSSQANDQANDIAAMNAEIKANTEAISGKADKNHTHIKSDITDFPTSLPANGGTADCANVPTGFEKIGNQDIWGNQDGVFITDWKTFPTPGLDNSGDISFRFNKGQLNIIIDGVFYQNEGKYKLVDENSLKDIMKPNYTTGRFPAGVYSGGETVSVSASITTTRGNPVFISYFGDFNSAGSGDTVPWVWFALYADDVLLQRTSVDNSAAVSSDNTSFAGSALAVLSAGSHTIRLDAVLYEGSTGKIQFQEQETYVNLVAFEL